MKARYLTKNRQITIEVEGETVKTVFQELASIQEIFDAESFCGMPDCKSANLRLMTRKVAKGNKIFDFYHLACCQCFARFDFGQTAVGGALFPKRKDDDGKYLPNRGWYKYTGPAEPTHPQGNQEPWS